LTVELPTMRSVVRKPSPRCSSCLLSPRWCVCAAQHDVQVPLSVAVLSHQREFTKPSSTGNLIKRLLPASVQHRWDPAAPLLPAQVVKSCLPRQVQTARKYCCWMVRGWKPAAW